MSDKTIRGMRAAFSMTRQRCYSPECKDYKYYGGRGITICQRWLDSFDNLLADMGLRPDGLTLERKDNDGPYSKENCVWATRKEQGRNTRAGVRLTFEGVTRALGEWSAITGIPYSTLKARINRLGYTPEQALTKPVRYGVGLPDKVYKKRRVPDMSKIARGLSHANTKFSREQVLLLRSLHAQGATYSALGRQFHVSIETASQVVQGHGAYKDI